MTAEQSRLASVMVQVVDRLVADFDFLDLAHSLVRSSVELLNATSAGVLVVDKAKELQMVAASHEADPFLEIFELQRHQGPAYECWLSGEVIQESALAKSQRWSEFAAKAMAQGCQSTVAVPLRLRGQTLGALNVLWPYEGPVSPSDIQAAQALADLASVGLGQQAASIDPRQVALQLDQAVQSRTMVEQAKGMLVIQSQIPLDAAFELLSDYSQFSGTFLREVALQVIQREINADSIQAALAAKFK